MFPGRKLLQTLAREEDNHLALEFPKPLRVQVAPTRVQRAALAAQLLDAFFGDQRPVQALVKLQDQEFTAEFLGLDEVPRVLEHLVQSHPERAAEWQ